MLKKSFRKVKSTQNINQATTILLISGFMKKATKDYDKEIKKAIKILEKWTDQN
jgi:hypothetical protein